MNVSQENKENPNPMQGANPFSVILFTYTIGMFKKGYQKTLEVTDLYNPLHKDRSKLLGDRLQQKWDAHLLSLKDKSIQPSLARVLVKTFWPEYLFLGLMLALLELVFRLAQPIYLGYLLQYFRQTSSMTKQDALFNAGALVALNACITIMFNQYLFRAFHYGMRVRAAVCSLIYRKALKLNRTALGETASGKIVNLLSNDVSRFNIVSVFIHYMWAAPASACIVMYCLWKEAGYAGIIGVIPFFIVVPLQSYTGTLSSKFRRETAYKTDKRVRLMDEIINGIQVIKMYAWEKPFEKLIRVSRINELKKVIKLSYVRGMYMTFNLITTRLALFSAILTMVLSGQPITATSVFVFTSYFNMLSTSMSTMFVRGVSEIAELFVAIKRLQEFLLNDEFENTSNSDNTIEFKDSSKDGKKNEVNEVVSAQMKNVTAKWDRTKSENALNDITLTTLNGTLLGIIGPVGSGKSTMLQTLLGELDVISGEITINGKLSYASQDPWLFVATIRQNIIFGEEYNKKRYDEVIRACALDKDFKQFEHGDKTMVGDRGASLSGGQKARISLARAVYRQADIYLLDDPLSAVDVHVGSHLYKECIDGFLGDKTRILVTHQVHLLKEADHIVILKDGTIEAEGSFQSLSINHDVHYAKLLTKEEELELKKPDDKSSKGIARKRSRQKSDSKSQSSSSLYTEKSARKDEEQDVEQANMLEKSNKDTVEGSLFLKYMHAAGNSFLMITVFALYILAQMSASGVDYFVSFWTDIEEKRRVELLWKERIYEYKPSLTCLYIYSGLIVTLAITALTRSMLFYKLAMHCSQKLHDNMFKSLIHTSMRFFETNPSGRILNRFSKDIGSIDELLPLTVLDSLQILLMMFGSLILVAVVNPLLLLPLGGITIVFQLMKVVYLRCSTNIKRLEGTMRSPVFTHLNASIQGLTTIRAYGVQQVLTDEFDKHQDSHTGAWFMYIIASSAFGFYLDALCLIFIGFVIFSFLTFAENSFGGQVGLAITQATAMTGFVQIGMRQVAEVINHLTSVERVLEYSNLEEEQQPLVPRTPPTKWPEFGKVEFKKMGLRYSLDMDPILKNLNVQIQPMEKVGIVGRTGAGKSSLIAAIFRLAFVEGDIEIDSVNTETITLQELRSKIAIIPQDPVLFSGTLRYNLDPFEEYPDDVLYKALEDVELKDSANIMIRLENCVMERGSNYSVGQRQLICLARAIIRKNKVLMLDEATANVDPQTDALIQKTIRQKFTDCTVLTVAHRLNTIMDSDKVMVMDQGSIVEFGHPYELLGNPQGIFKQMVQGTGSQMAEQLKNIARHCYSKIQDTLEDIA